MSEEAADVLPEAFSTRNSPQPHQVQHLEAAYSKKKDTAKNLGLSEYDAMKVSVRAWK